MREVERTRFVAAKPAELDRTLSPSALLEAEGTFTVVDTSMTVTEVRVVDPSEDDAVLGTAGVERKRACSAEEPGSVAGSGAVGDEVCGLSESGIIKSMHRILIKIIHLRG